MYNMDLRSSFLHFLTLEVTEFMFVVYTFIIHKSMWDIGFMIWDCISFDTGSIVLLYLESNLPLNKVAFSS